MHVCAHVHVWRMCVHLCVCMHACVRVVHMCACVCGMCVHTCVRVAHVCPSLCTCVHACVCACVVCVCACMHVCVCVHVPHRCCLAGSSRTSHTIWFCFVALGAQLHPAQIVGGKKLSLETQACGAGPNPLEGFQEADYPLLRRREEGEGPEPRPTRGTGRLGLGSATGGLFLSPLFSLFFPGGCVNCPLAAKRGCFLRTVQKSVTK